MFYFFFFFLEESRNIWCEEQPVRSNCVMSPVNGGSWDYKTHSCEDDSLIWNAFSRRRNVRLRWDLSCLHFPKVKKKKRHHVSKCRPIYFWRRIHLMAAWLLIALDSTASHHKTTFSRQTGNNRHVNYMVGVFKYGHYIHVCQLIEHQIISKKWSCISKPDQPGPARPGPAQRLSLAANLQGAMGQGICNHV